MTATGHGDQANILDAFCIVVTVLMPVDQFLSLLGNMPANHVAAVVVPC